MYNLVIVLLLFSSIIALVMLYIAIYVRKAPKSLYFTYMILSVLLFNFGYLLELSGGGFEASVMAARIQYLGIPFIAPFLFLFVLEYCVKKPIKKRYMALLMAIPALASFFVVTWPLCGLHYKDLVYVSDVLVPRLIVVPGAFYYVYIAYTNIIAFLSIGLALYYRNKGDARFKKQISPVVFASMLPILSTLVNVFHLGNLPIDTTPIFLSVTCACLGYAVVKQGLYMLAPIAQEQIVENMSDGLILVDNHGMFMDANPAAKRFFTELATLEQGSPMPALYEMSWGDGDAIKEFYTTDETGISRYYRASQNRIENNGRTIGQSIVVYDITEAKEHLDKISEMAERDALTGLINRGTLFKQGKAIFAQLGAQSSAAVLMIDIDFFKNINDTYGHISGDEVLKTVAQTIHATLRATDIVGRYGGEEFCVFLPHIKVETAHSLAEKLRAGIEGLAFNLSDHKISVTISIGLAGFDAGRHQTFESLLADADSLLYEAKNGGRNRIKSGIPSGGA